MCVAVWLIRQPRCQNAAAEKWTDSYLSTNAANTHRETESNSVSNHFMYFVKGMLVRSLARGTPSVPSWTVFCSAPAPVRSGGPALHGPLPTQQRLRIARQTPKVT